MPRKGSTRLTLRPGDPGTKRLQDEYGDRLIAVRYRYDSEALRRYTTVEIVVDERPWHGTPNVADPDRLVGLRVNAEETNVQRGLRSAGGRWDARVRLWWAPLHVVFRLGYEQRIVRWSAPDEISRAG